MTLLCLSLVSMNLIEKSDFVNLWANYHPLEVDYFQPFVEYLEDQNAFQNVRDYPLVLVLFSSSFQSNVQF